MKKILIILLAVIGSLTANARKDKNLQEVTVVASRTINNAEGYTVNLQGTAIAKGKPTADLLGFLPNISREDGIFKINGLAVSEIYVDGIRLTDISELDNIPAGRIDKVQVKYLAGSDRSAALSGGIIMISLRRPPEGGFYGNIDVDAGWRRACGFGSYGAWAMFNYRYKNLSVYDNLYSGADKYKETAEQSFFNTGESAEYYEISKWHGFNVRNRLSLSQRFASGAIFGGSYHIASSNLKPESITSGDNMLCLIDKKKETLAQEGTLKFSLPFGRRCASMELTADYFNRHSDETAGYYTDGTDPDGIREKYNLDLWKFNADFTYPFSRKSVWQFGASLQYLNSRYNPIVCAESRRFETECTPAESTGLTPAVYASAKGSLRKMRYSIGLTWQLNRIEYSDLKAGVRNRNTQWSINPTVFMMMPFGSRMQHAVMLNYKRTLGEIPYTAVSSVVSWSDANNYSVGNPDLKAQSADMLMAGVSLFRNKVNLTALYMHSHNRIWWQTFQDSDNESVYYTMPVNISGQGAFGFGAEWMESPVERWRFKLSGRIEITPENLTIGGIHYGKTRFKEYFSFNNSFSFSRGWGGMLNATLEPTYRSYDRTYHAVYNIGGRIHKSLMNDNLTLALDFTALGNRRKLDRRTGSSVVSYKYTTPVQSVEFSLTWNFSGGKKVDVDVIDGTQEYRETKDNI